MTQKNITQMVIRQMSNPKNWTKKKIGALTIAVAAAWLGNHFVGADTNTRQQGTAKRGQTYAAKVTKVADGDTATVVDNNGTQHKIRFAYIDAPEKAQAHGMASKDALEKLIDGKQVSIYVTDVDRYQREVAVVSLNGLDVNLEQIKNGNAWHYQTYAKKSQPTADYNKYAAALKNAEQNRIGLWRGKNPQQPWDWRTQQRQSDNSE